MGRNFFGKNKKPRKPTGRVKRVKKYGHGGYLNHKGGIRPVQRDPQGACTQQNCNGQTCRRGSSCISKMFQGNLSCSCVADSPNYQGGECKGDRDCLGYPREICRNNQCVFYHETPGYNPETPGTVDPGESMCVDCTVSPQPPECDPLGSCWNYESCWMCPDLIVPNEMDFNNDFKYYWSNSPGTWESQGQQCLEECESY